MKRSKSSSRWLNEHVNDPYVKQAQKDGYRSRAAYKLIEINEKDKLIRPGMLMMNLLGPRWLVADRRTYGGGHRPGNRQRHPADGFAR